MCLSGSYLLTLYHNFNTNMATDVLRPNTANPHVKGKNGYNNDELVDTTIKVNDIGNVKTDTGRERLIRTRLIRSST